MRGSDLGASRRLPWTTRVAAAGWWSVAAGLAAVYVYMAVRLPGGPDGMSDLGVYVGAARTLLADGSLYAFVSFNGDRFIYPPFAGLALLPFALLPELWLRVLWTLLQCVEVVVLAWVVTRRAPHPTIVGSRRPVALPLLTCLLLITQPVFTGLFLGQVSLLVTLLALLDALDLTPPRLRGVPTGLAAAIKLTPLAFVPFLWLTGRRRAAVTALATSVLCALAAWIVLPAESHSYWSSALSTPDFVNLAQSDNQSVQGFLARTGWPQPTSTTVSVCVLLAVVVLGGVRSRRAHRDGQLLAAAVIVGAVVVLVSPISWSHHQTVLVIAAACTVSAASRAVNALWSAAVLLLMTIPFQLLLNRWWPAGQLLTDSVLVVLALLIVCVIPFRAAPRSAPWEPQPRARIRAMSSANLTSESSTGA